MIERQDVIWQTDSLVQTFLQGVRGGIPYASDQIEIMLRLLQARNAPLYNFLDLGCGSGVLTGAILSRNPTSHGTLVDFSDPMLAAAHDQLEKYSDILEFIRADLASPSFWQHLVSKFDAIVSGFAIHHLEHDRKRALYAEIYDRLEPNGLFINIEHVSSASPWLEQLSDELLIDSLYSYHLSKGGKQGRSQIAAEFVYRPDKVANILAPGDTQCEWLREIGFQDVDCYFKSFELAVFGGRKRP